MAPRILAPNTLFVLSATLLLTACSLPITPKGETLHVVGPQDHGLLSRCELLGHTTGKANTGGGGKSAAQKAVNEALNKAAQIPGADTVVVDSDSWWLIGRQAKVAVYRCHSRNNKAPVVTRKQRQPLSTPVVPVLGQDTQRKLDACARRGGTWNNNRCVMPIQRPEY